MVFSTRLFLLVFKFCCLNAIFLSFVMEEQKPAIPELPNELIESILNLNGQPPIIQKHFLKMETFGYPKERCSVSSNLNSLEIKESGFALQCWYCETNNRGYFRINDDTTKKRYLRNGEKNVYEHFFDGINNFGIFLIIAQFNSEEFSSNTYNFYLGKITSRHKKFYSSSIYSLSPHFDDNQPFNYESKKSDGYISAFALCKTANRFVLIDNKRKIKVFDITGSSQNSDLHISCLVENTCPTIIKKISFITPFTLLALSEEGELFTVALDPKKQKNYILFFKQHFKKKNNEFILFSHFAIDSCSPCQILLLSKNNQCIYWNIISKQLFQIMEIENQVKSFWFYGDTLGYLDNENNFNRFHYKQLLSHKQLLSQISGLQRNYKTTPPITYYSFYIQILSRLFEYLKSYYEKEGHDEDDI